jgi:cytochrome P450
VTAKIPTTDWVHDFDPTDPRWINDPAPILREIRSKCPVAHTDRMLGVYLSTTYDATRAIALNTDAFSSRRILVRDTRPDYLVTAPPICNDPPHHSMIKQILMPPFTREATRKLEPRIRATCSQLLDELAGRTSCDASQDYARHVAARTMTNLLGVPEQDSDLLLKWIHDIFDAGVTDNSALIRGIKESEAYFGGLLNERRQHNEDDMITLLANAKDADGRPLTDPYIQATLRVMMMAGIDTSLCVIASALWHLAQAPADRARLIAEPSLFPSAIEEFLRMFPPVTAGREVVQDAEVQGCPMTTGNMVLVSYMAANRDPAVFPDPETVMIDRRDNRHLAFGVGIHRCIGLHLGRAEMTIAVEEWLKRIPDFRLDPALEVKFSVGQVRGPQVLPLLLGPAAALAPHEAAGQAELHEDRSGIATG